MVKGIMLLKISTLAFLFSFAKAESIGCEVEGECVFSQELGVVHTEDFYSCGDSCSDEPGCNFYTFHEISTDCVLYSECNEFSSDGPCTDCVSGELTCSCFSPGQCVEAILIGSAQTDNEISCLDLCKDTDGCLWITFDKAGSLCLLQQDCPGVDQTDTDFVHAEKSCGDEGGGDDTKPAYLMVVGGAGDNDNDPLENVEIVALDSSPPCGSVPANFPREDYGMVGGYLQEKVIVCGGKTPSYTSNCQLYDFDSNVWTRTERLITSRGFATSVVTDDGEFLVIGGANPSSVNTSEIVENLGDHFAVFGDDLPDDLHSTPFRISCGFLLNRTHVFMCGGETGPRSAYLFSLTGEWTKLPNMRVERRSHACGLVDGGDVVVVGGHDHYRSVERFSFSTMSWTQLEDFPRQMVGAASVPYGRDSFLIVGGIDYLNPGDDRLDTIYQFVNNSWVERSEKLSLARYSHTAIGLPNVENICD